MDDDLVLRAYRLASPTDRRTTWVLWPRFLLAATLLSTAIWQPTVAVAVTPESREVRQLIEQGLKSLEGHSEDRLGGLCLIALAFLKEGASSDNHHVLTAVRACENTTAQQARGVDVYSNGLAIILLAELDPKKYRGTLERFATAMADRQKKNGAWGYDSDSAGDTSQTQYAALCYWELLQVGMAPKVERVEACANWLLRTQDPNGGWGYHGKDPGNFEPVKQSKTTASMLAAGLGSTMIFGNVLGLTKPRGLTESAQSKQTPSALRRADVSSKKMRSLSGNGVDKERLLNAISKGQNWFNQNYQAEDIRKSLYTCYMLYALERYKSFEELLTGNVVEEPLWYQQGFEYLKATQLPEGGWSSRSRRPCSTAFAVLFLLRSTQKSIKANLGEGTLIGGRGLSANLSRMKMRRGQLVTEENPTEIDKFLGMLDTDSSESLEALVNDSSALQVNNVGPEQARRLQQLVKSGTPAVRILAVRALSKLRSLDYVPSLLYAMTDPDRRVVREARDGLRFVSRRFEGYGLSDNFSENERYSALDKWKSWYRRIRPGALPLP